MPQEPDATSNEAPPYRFSLGTYGEPASMKFLLDLTEAEFKEISRAISAIAQLDTPFHYSLVERNFTNLKDTHQFITITLSIGREFAVLGHGQAGHALMNSAVNWLTSMRLFLDHTETGLKRQFGKNSSEVQKFKAATKSAFDTKPGYRFSYKFRNYVQHCGLPLSRIELTPLDEEGARTRARQSAALLLNRDALLANYEEWGPARHDLESMQPKFALLPLVSEAMEGLRDVYLALFDIRLTEALSLRPVLEQAIARLDNVATSERPAIFRCYIEPSGNLQITPRILPEEAITHLKSVDDGLVTRESLLKWEESTPPNLDPATVRDRFHRDSRGVQVLTAWLAERGTTPAFFSAVNSILAEDRSIGPLLTGLINASVTFAHMTATTFGVTAESLVASLLNIYGPFDQLEGTQTDEQTPD